ncbi:Auxilin-like clathrin uncoating factor SWA2 [Nakaseomyces bracarensis]|uniref:Auxilin-like clathrin uncoating factor SWA2 n=1 Tax=Nakaseomyces bracarensis TaxID=273131 RepID=A0ABR4NYM2_9SACH
MSDPFGHLLTSLKEGNPPSRSPSVKLTNESLSSVTPQTHIQTQNAQQHPQKKKLIPLHEDSLIAGSSQSATIHDDFDDLFGSIPQKDSPAPGNQELNQNENKVQDVFDVFENGFNSHNKINNLKPDNYQSVHNSELDTAPKPKTSDIGQKEVVVDEVKDMEIAKLMSIGLSIEKANKYYNSGILYEDVVQRRRAKQRTPRSPRSHAPQEDAEEVEVRKLFDKAITNSQRQNSDSLSSWASGLLSKGKDIVNQLSTYPEEENARMRKFSSPRRESSLDFSDSNESLTSSRINSPMRKISPRASLQRPTMLSGASSRSNVQQEWNKTRVQHDSPSPGLISPRSGNQSDISLSTNQSSEDHGTQEATLLDFDNDEKNSSEVPVSLTSSSSIQLSNVAISEIELSGYNEFRTRATEYFQKGDYSGAVQEYEKSLNTLPSNHPLRVIAYSNIIASRIKIGEHSKSISDANSALELFPADKSQWKGTIQNSNPTRSYQDIWPKIVLRLAESYEAIEKYKMALETYQSLLESNVFNDKIIAGKRRCQHALGLDSKPPKALNGNIKKDNTPKTAPKKQEPSGAKPSENTERVKRENERLAKLEDEKVALYDQVDSKISVWVDSKEDDIRFLLSNLQNVLTWCEWKPVSSADLVMPKKVKVTYMKAVARTHPDKIQSSLELENQMIAERVFSLLSKAWEKFRESNDI